MIPANARPAHRRLRHTLAQIAEWAETSPLVREHAGADDALGLVADGVAVMHAREAAPGAAVLALGIVHPLPLGRIRSFAGRHRRCAVVEEGDPCLEEALLAAGIPVTGRPEPFRFGELSVDRVRRLLSGDGGAEPAIPRGKPPQLCNGCPHRVAYAAFQGDALHVAGDIGCYSLGALPPFEAMDTLVCMGAAIGVGLGMRRSLPRAEAMRVVSVIGDSTFVHSGLTGIVEMVYNPPETGHVVVILDNGTTAMTGLQEHPATGRTLAHEPTGRIDLAAVVRACGVPHVDVLDMQKERDRLPAVLRGHLEACRLAVVICRQPCLLAAKRIRELDARDAARSDGCEGGCHAG